MSPLAAAWVGVLRPGRAPRCAAAALGVALLALAAIAAAADPSPSPAGPVAEAEAQRVVSLNPSLTAILIALGAGDRIVGIDDYSARQQPSLADRARVGGLYNPSLEAVVALRPDLVVLVPSAEQRAFRDRLAELEVPRLVLDPTRFEDVLASIATLGARVGRADAATERIAAIRAMQAEVEAAVRGRPRVRTVLVLQRDPLFLIGSGNFIDDMLTSAGARNLGAELDGSYPRSRASGCWTRPPTC